MSGLGRRWAHIDVDTAQKYMHWRQMWERGRKKLQKKTVTPEGQAQLRAEAARLPREPHYRSARPHTDGHRPPAVSIPACLSTVSIRRSPRGQARRSLLSFPPEIRNMIYQYAVLYPTSRTMFDAYYQQSPELRDAVRLQTPTILLLCKQITREALTIMRSQAFVLDRVPPWIMGHGKPLPLTTFVSRTTLQHMRYVEVRGSLGDGTIGHGPVWIEMIEQLLAALSTDNHVVQLKVLIKIKDVMNSVTYLYELKFYEVMLRKLREWEFSMSRGPGIVRLEHWVIDNQHAFSTGWRNPVIRFWPDPDLWTGSVLEWV